MRKNRVVFCAFPNLINSQLFTGMRLPSWELQCILYLNLPKMVCGMIVLLPLTGPFGCVTTRMGKDPIFETISIRTVEVHLRFRHVV